MPRENISWWRLFVGVAVFLVGIALNLIPSHLDLPDSLALNLVGFVTTSFLCALGFLLGLTAFFTRSSG